jgi:hypothetical protein
VLNALMRPRGARQTAPRRFFSTLSAAVRSVVAPAGLFADQAPAEPVTAPDPADTYSVDDMPAVEDIERAALSYDLASDNARRADRAKRAARKVLDKVPSGIHGRYRIFRTPSSRMTPDLAEITRIFKANGLGPVPMKPCAPSLKVELVAAVPTDLAEFAEVAA